MDIQLYSSPLGHPSVISPIWALSHPSSSDLQAQELQVTSQPELAPQYCPASHPLWTTTLETKAEGPPHRHAKALRLPCSFTATAQRGSVQLPRRGGGWRERRPGRPGHHSLSPNCLRHLCSVTLCFQMTLKSSNMLCFNK